MDRTKKKVKFKITKVVEDLSQVQIARLLKVSPPRIYKISKRYGLGYFRFGAGNIKFYKQSDVNFITNLIKERDEKRKKGK